MPRVSDIDGLPIETAIAAQAWRIGGTRLRVRRASDPLAPERPLARHLALTATTPPPPALLTTTTVCPNALPKGSAMVRAMMSVVPPGANGTCN